jgi:hypothetical protein
MLRPTESAVLWLQQLGRGLRYVPGKRLKIIDYIGNHRSFLIKPRTLFQLDGGDAELWAAFKAIDENRAGELLPPGCSVTYDLEAKEILRSLLRRTPDVGEHPEFECTCTRRPMRSLSVLPPAARRPSPMGEAVGNDRAVEDALHHLQRSPPHDYGPSDAVRRPCDTSAPSALWGVLLDADGLPIIVRYRVGP